MPRALRPCSDNGRSVGAEAHGEVRDRARDLRRALGGAAYALGVHAIMARTRRSRGSGGDGSRWRRERLVLAHPSTHDTSMPQLHSAKLPPPRSADEFEDICVEAMRIRWGVTTQRVGRSGQRQKGVDIVGTRDGTTLGAQCKNVGELTLGTVLSAVEDAKTFRPALALLALATTYERDAELQEEVRMHLAESPPPFAVEVIFWQDLLASLAREREVIRHFWPQFFAEVEQAAPLVTHAGWRREPTIEDLRLSSAWPPPDEHDETGWERDLARMDCASSLCEFTAPAGAPAGSAIEFVQDQAARWKRATERARVSPDSALEICFVHCTDDAELDVGVRNVSGADVIISEIEVVVLKDFGYVAPELFPTARYELPVGNLGVGDRRAVRVAHVVPAGEADRILVALDDARTLLLHLILRTRNGRGASADAWLFPAGFDEDLSEDEATADAP
jgi:hypothetical protein